MLEPIEKNDVKIEMGFAEEEPDPWEEERDRVALAVLTLGFVAGLRNVEDTCYTSRKSIELGEAEEADQILEDVQERLKESGSIAEEEFDRARALVDEVRNYLLGTEEDNNGDN